MERNQNLQRHAELFDFARKPSSKVGWLVRFGVMFVAALFLFRTFQRHIRPMLRERPPTPIVEGVSGDMRFGLAEKTRREIFGELAAAEISERERAIKANSWNGHLWSREDDRGHYERIAIRASARRHNVSLSVVYLVLDEGIREHWLGPDGNPLAATTPPLKLRTDSW